MDEIKQKVLERINEGKSDFYADKFFPDESSEKQLGRFENEVIPFLDELADDREIEILHKHPKFENGREYIDCVLVRVID